MYLTKLASKYEMILELKGHCIESQEIELTENIALLLHPHVDVRFRVVWSLRNLTLDGKLCLRDDKKCCLCIISPSLAMEGQSEKRHNVRAQQQEAVSD